MYTFNTNFLFLHASISLSLSLSLCLDLGLFIHLSVCLWAFIAHHLRSFPSFLNSVSNHVSTGCHIAQVNQSHGHLSSECLPNLICVAWWTTVKMLGYIACSNPPPLLNYTLSSHEHKIALRVTTCMLYLPDTRWAYKIIIYLNIVLVYLWKCLHLPFQCHFPF